MWGVESLKGRDSDFLPLLMKLIEESSCDSIIDYALSTVKIVELLILLLEFEAWSCQYFFIPTQYNLY